MVSNFLIAGPCAAETEEQVLQTARALLPLQPVFRAGLWKPRTHPNTFQGVGEKGLIWLQQVQQQVGLDVATEVATPGQMRLCLQAGIDYVWIGARTAANPIAVQELADTLHEHSSAGQLKGVWIKNPTNEDTPLWIGNILRFRHAVEGTDIRLAAIHRGCNHRPCWDMAYTLRQSVPNIPLVLDASHMSGDSEQIEQLLNQAEYLTYDGAMVEVHPQPQQALSDAKQQITPQRLIDIMQAPMETDTADTPPANFPHTPLDLRWLRAMMDEVDDVLWQTIARRMSISRRIGEWKRGAGVAVLQPARFEDIVRKRLNWAKSNGLSEQTVTAVYEALHKESIRQQ
ncbi:MAG: bifunctional 3-deoxy-7-phosphoheptulonate synthase/chorismate mutase type II [Paludibacteraceae bacterium]|nr:bifunctional 3-deoxy-7-phosphoheptulonate synthase/chorismate mutase type II [Paludibacteraceae bacterium]